MSLEERASRIAAERHAGQTDKGGRPYIEHPAYVASKMETDEEKAVAWLHDTIEDTGLTLHDLRKEGFPDSVIEAVRALTHLPHQSYGEYVSQVAKNPLARKVKVADIFHNMDLERLPDVEKADLARLERYRTALEILNP